MILMTTKITMMTLVLRMMKIMMVMMMRMMWKMMRMRMAIKMSWTQTARDGLCCNQSVSSASKPKTFLSQHFSTCMQST